MSTPPERIDHDLATLLTRASAASPNDRIHLRDLIAAHGDGAIKPMRAWLSDARLGAFAVRVLEASPDRDGAVTALKAERTKAATASIRGDIDAALLRLKAAAIGSRAIETRGAGVSPVRLDAGRGA